jgi:hypothetical protein
MADVRAASHAYENLALAASRNPQAVTPAAQRTLATMKGMTPAARAEFMAAEGWNMSMLGEAGLSRQLANTGRIGLPTAAGGAARAEAVAVERAMAQGATRAEAEAAVRAEAAAAPAAGAAPAAEGAVAEGGGTGFKEWWKGRTPMEQAMLGVGGGLGAHELVLD